MAFIDNFAHGDLHPGNIFVIEEDGRGNRKRLPSLAFLDVGIVTELR